MISWNLGSGELIVTVQKTIRYVRFQDTPIHEQIYRQRKREVNGHVPEDEEEESLVYTTTEDVFLVLATEFVAPASVKVWFLSEKGEVICGYARADDLDSSYLLDEDIPQISFFPAGEGLTDIGLMPLFIVSGEQPTADAEDDPAETQVDTVPDEQQPDAETPDDAAGLQPEQGELGDAAEQLPVTDMEEILPPEEDPDAPVLAAPGDYVSVTTDTRVLEYVNEYAIEDYSVSGEVIRVKINEAYVVPDEMRRFVNYTTIQTGVNLAVTGVMWVGIGLMVISGTAGLIRKRRAGKHEKN